MNHTRFRWLKILILSFLCCGSCVSLIQAQQIPQSFLTSPDLSTPEKCVHHFYEAFRTGNAGLLAEVLIEGGSYAEFSPQYRIETPSPVIAGAEIARKTVIRKWGGSDDPIQVDDVLIYALTKKNPIHITRKPGMAMPDEKFCFVVRKISGQWKLVKVYPGWPAFLRQ